mmetsp:Transcript_42332/g.100584  ORF Transcript_42332/g.100584 Transcript_42332/m.100584 type:complete len:238 (+) Transcript_42332:501-1214(+)
MYRGLDLQDCVRLPNGEGGFRAGGPALLMFRGGRAGKRSTSSHLLLLLKEVQLLLFQLKLQPLLFLMHILRDHLRVRRSPWGVRLRRPGQKGAVRGTPCLWRDCLGGHGRGRLPHHDVVHDLLVTFRPRHHGHRTVARRGPAREEHRHRPLAVLLLLLRGGREDTHGGFALRGGVLAERARRPGVRPPQPAPRFRLEGAHLVLQLRLHLRQPLSLHLSHEFVPLLLQLLQTQTPCQP